MRPDGPVLRRQDYTVRPVPLVACQEKVRKYHYWVGEISEITEQVVTVSCQRRLFEEE